MRPLVLHPGKMTRQPGVIESWEPLAKKYTSEGLSKNAAYVKIAKQYGTSKQTVYYWLDPTYRTNCRIRGARYRGRLRRNSTTKSTQTTPQATLESLV